MAVEWHYQESGFPRGPVTSQQLRDLATGGTINPATPIRRVSEGEASRWLRAGEIKGLFHGDMTRQMGGPICDACGSKLIGDRCPICLPASPPPPPLIAAPISPVVGDDPTSERYRHLRRYLFLTTVSATVLFVSIIILMVLGLALSVYHAYESWPFFIGSALFVAIGYVGYLATLSVVQFVQVVLDIEDNTRQAVRLIRESTK